MGRVRERLPELGPVNRSIHDFIEYKVCVVMEAFYVGAGKKECGVSAAANIEIGRVSTVNSTEITHRNCRLRPFSRKKNALHSQHHVSRPIHRSAVCTVMRERFVPYQQFDPARYGEFHHLIQARLRRNPW